MSTLLADSFLGLSRSKTARRVAIGSAAAMLLIVFVFARADAATAAVFHPHGYCYLWRPGLVAGHVVSDVLIGFSYVAISLTLWYLVRRARGAIPFSWVFIAFGTFIVACGGTHFMEIVTLWEPVFWSSMGVKIVTAVASVATALVLPPLVPHVLALLDSVRVSEDRRLALAAAHDELEERVSRELLLRTEAQTANAKKDEFLANMSHELRTPLNVIIGFSEVIHRGTAGPITPEQREYLGDIISSSKHLLQLINDVLDLAKVESGTMDIRPESVDVGALVTEVRDMLRGLAAAKRLHLRTEIDASVGTATVDPARVKQILYNYVTNAIKFTPEDGTVTIRVAAEGLSMFRIDVEDTGVGIAAQNIDKLFVEFQQLDASAAKRYQGTGLGLALTKRLAEAQGGRVEVRSTEGDGSTFSAILPREVGLQAPPRSLNGTGTERRCMS